jgi:hypothetical protein
LQYGPAGGRGDDAGDEASPKARKWSGFDVVTIVVKKECCALNLRSLKFGKSVNASSGGVRLLARSDR